MRGVATLRIKQYEEYQLSVVTRAESQSKIAYISSNLKPNSKGLQILIKGLRRKPFVKKYEETILVDCSL
jgi:hypothetical protein